MFPPTRLIALSVPGDSPAGLSAKHEPPAEPIALALTDLEYVGELSDLARLDLATGCPCDWCLGRSAPQSPLGLLDPDGWGVPVPRPAPAAPLRIIRIQPDDWAGRQRTAVDPPQSVRSLSAEPEAIIEESLPDLLAAPLPDGAVIEMMPEGLATRQERPWFLAQPAMVTAPIAIQHPGSDIAPLPPPPEPAPATFAEEEAIHRFLRPGAALRRVGDHWVVIKP